MFQFLGLLGGNVESSNNFLGLFKKKHYKCLFCGYTPLYILKANDEICPVCATAHYAQDLGGMVSPSFHVGLECLCSIYAYYEGEAAFRGEVDFIRTKKADRKDEALRWKIKESIIETLPFYRDESNEKRPRIYKTISKNGTSRVIGESFCNELIDYYIDEYNRDPSWQIKKIEVKGLFGHSSFNFTLNKDLSIIYGPNGIGKTTVFKILESLFLRPTDDHGYEKNIEILFKIPFSSFKVEFYDGIHDTFTVHKLKTDDETRLIFAYPTYGLISINGTQRPKGLSVLSINGTAEEFKESGYAKLKEHYQLLETHIPDSSDYFLFVTVNRSSDNKMINFTNDFQENLNSLILELNSGIKGEITVKDLSDYYKYLEKQTDEYKTKDGIAERVKIIDDVMNNDNGFYGIRYHMRAFYENFKLFKQKFEFFTDGSKRVKIKEDGNVCFVTQNHIELSPYELSSGELNIATILYYTIFKTSSGAIVLIDEPEVSLHLIWQEAFSDVMMELLKKRPDMQVILASHSPFIASGHSDKMVGANYDEEQKPNE